MIRLVEVETLRLEVFFDEDRPEYCILSHRWGNIRDETTLQRFEAEREHLGTADEAARCSPGTRKVGAFCRVVRERTAIRWCWVDTCCIDKASSAELTEAINSMYRWYRDAAVCYAYIDDVPGREERERELLKRREERQQQTENGDGSNDGGYIDDDNDSESDSNTSFLAASVWFTRGWTLQELLAPRVQVFLDRDWADLGSRTALAPAIAVATGIPPACFGDEGAVRARCVAERMSWVGRRRTSRVEDMAYCMLGIFGVYLPLIYGEGLNAFRRLQEEIIRTSDDETIFAWLAAAEATDNGVSGSGGNKKDDGDDEKNNGGENDANAGWSMLAAHPVDFTRQPGVELSAGSDYIVRKPYAITNKGLHFEIVDSPQVHRFRRIDIVLNVRRAGDGALFAVLLEHVGSHRWHRINAAEPIYADTSSPRVSNPEHPSLVRQKIFLEA